MAEMQKVIQLSKEKVRREVVTPQDDETINVLEALLSEGRGEGVSKKVFSAFTLDELTSMAGEIAAYKSRLDRMLAKMLRSKKFYELILVNRESSLRKGTIDVLEKEMAKKYVTETAIKTKIKSYTLNTRIKIVYIESLYEQYLYLWRSANHMIDAIQSRCNFLMSDRADNRYGDDGMNFDLAEVHKKMKEEEKEAEESGEKTTSE